MIEHTVSVNGIEVTAAYSERAVNELFIPLLKKLSEMHIIKGSRILAMLAAPPGAGKSTLLSFLEILAHEHQDIDDIQVIGMDGFHRRQEYLKTHYVTRDGRQIPMVDIKGAPVTFDLDKLTERVRNVSEGEICDWPVYDRMLHNPVEDVIRIDGNIVILEGNYLLLDEDGWRELHNYADYTISIRAGEDLLRERLIDRRMKTGVSGEAATRFVDYSDMPNVRLCLKKTMPSDMQLTVDSNGEYT